MLSQHVITHNWSSCHVFSQSSRHITPSSHITPWSHMLSHSSSTTGLTGRIITHYLACCHNTSSDTTDLRQQHHVCLSPTTDLAQHPTMISHVATFIIHNWSHTTHHHTLSRLLSKLLDATDLKQQHHVCLSPTTDLTQHHTIISHVVTFIIHNWSPTTRRTADHPWANGLAGAVARASRT